MNWQLPFQPQTKTTPTAAATLKTATKQEQFGGTKINNSNRSLNNSHNITAAYKTTIITITTVALKIKPKQQKFIKTIITIKQF